MIKIMKSYTDIEQSKKLSEILLIESADMHYVRKATDFMGNPVDGEWSIPKYGSPNSKHANYMVQNFTSYEKLPCWLLSALLDILPNGTVLKKSDNGRYFIGGLLYDNPLDVCVDMIYKLKENNLL